MTSRRSPSLVLAIRVRRNMVFAPMKAMFVPAFRAAVTCARSCGVQYSSWPAVNSACAPSSRCGSASMSMLVT